jgi:multidrug efflux pump subunit AcrB
MWIVKLVLRRPFPLAAMALLIVQGGNLPKIDIPVVSVVWQQTGLSPNHYEKLNIYSICYSSGRSNF